MYILSFTSCAATPLERPSLVDSPVGRAQVAGELAFPASAAFAIRSKKGIEIVVASGAWTCERAPELFNEGDAVLMLDVAGPPSRARDVRHDAGAHLIRWPSADGPSIMEEASHATVLITSETSESVDGFFDLEFSGTGAGAVRSLGGQFEARWCSPNVLVP